MTSRRSLLVVLILALCAFAAPTTTRAHANLVSSEPAANAKLTSAPKVVTLVFSEELDAKGNSINVSDGSGTQVDTGNTTLVTSDPERKTLTVSLKPGLGDGKYTVNWKNMSADGHAEEGDFSFTVGTAPATTAAPTTPVTTLPNTGEADPLPILAWGIPALLLLGCGMSIRRKGMRSS